ncbi:MAG: 16S rRNA (guanine(527)-N(7))-methyltransferase RsmG [Bacteroidales bacterium]|nr:16S rRNA (guanine(527)-N(7))-methyltransferase RsmG [Bacteroidales bacterium]
MDTKRLFEYFPDLTERQKEQYNQLKDLYLDWNSKINVISRKDMEHFYEHHVVHSLAIAKYFELLPGMKVMDLGTGGGFPGIPLAIMFPQTEFYLIDGTGKKIKVVNAVKDAIGLENVVAEQKRAEEVTEKFDVVTGRAVMTLPEIANLAGNRLRIRGDVEAGGILYLKGGDLTEEFNALNRYWRYKKAIISKWYKEEYFEEKFVIHLY